MSDSSFSTEFGIFYPTGWMVAAFPDGVSAEQARRDLFSGGYSEEDCRLASGNQVTPAARDQLHDPGWLGRLGKADDMVRQHLEAAEKGSVFLVIYAPTEPEAERAMNVIRRVPFLFAHRYRRFAIEVMK